MCFVRSSRSAGGFRNQARLERSEDMAVRLIGKGRHQQYATEVTKMSEVLKDLSEAAQEDYGKTSSITLAFRRALKATEKARSLLDDSWYLEMRHMIRRGDDGAREGLESSPYYTTAV